MDPELLLGKTAVDAGYVRREQVEECLRMQAEARRSGAQPKLGELLVSKGYLTAERRDWILKHHRFVEARAGDRRFGRLAIKNGFCTNEQVTDCLSIQAKEYSSTGRLTRIGALLVQKRYLDAVAVAAILSVQERLRGAPAAADGADPGRSHPGPGVASATRWRGLFRHRAWMVAGAAALLAILIPVVIRSWKRHGVSAVDRPAVEEAASSSHELDLKRKDLRPGDVTGRLHLASWCREHQLTDEEHRLFEEVLQIDSGNTQAHKRLGHMSWDGRWYPSFDALLPDVQRRLDEGRLADLSGLIRSCRDGGQKVRIAHLLDQVACVLPAVALEAVSQDTELHSLDNFLDLAGACKEAGRSDGLAAFARAALQTWPDSRPQWDRLLVGTRLHISSTGAIEGDVSVEEKVLLTGAAECTWIEAVVSADGTSGAWKLGLWRDPNDPKWTSYDGESYRREQSHDPQVPEHSFCDGKPNRWHVRTAAGDGPEYEGIDWMAVRSQKGTVVYVARAGEERWVVLGASKLGPFSEVRSPVLSADGMIFACAVKDGQGAFVLVEGERRGGPFEEVGGLAMSRDGATLAYSARAGDAEFVVIGDKQGEAFEHVTPPAVSADGRTIAYFGTRGSLPFEVLVWDGHGESRDITHEADVWGRLPRFQEGTGAFYSVCSENLPGATLSLDGQVIWIAPAPGASVLIEAGDWKSPRYDAVGPLAFRSGEKSATYAAKRGEDAFLVTGGREGTAFQDVGMLTVSPDRKVAYRAILSDLEFVCLGDYRSEMFDHVLRLAFSPDGQKLAFAAQRGHGVVWRVLDVKESFLDVESRLAALAGEPSETRGPAYLALGTECRRSSRWPELCSVASAALASTPDARRQWEALLAGTPVTLGDGNTVEARPLEVIESHEGTRKRTVSVDCTVMDKEVTVKVRIAASVVPHASAGSAGFRYCFGDACLLDASGRPIVWPESFRVSADGRSIVPAKFGARLVYHLPKEVQGWFEVTYVFLIATGAVPQNLRFSHGKPVPLRHRD